MARRLPGLDYSDPAFTIFVTACCKSRRRWFDDVRLAQAAVDAIQWVRVNRQTLVFAYCVMPDHLHLLMKIEDPTHNLGQVMSSLKLGVGREFRRIGHQGALWQPGFYDHVVREWEDITKFQAYVVNNPVRAEIVDQPEKYPWSGTLDLA